MLRKRRLIIGKIGAMLAASTLFVIQMARSQTLEMLEIIEETDQYVEVRVGGDTGRQFKSYSYSFDDPNTLNWFGPDNWAQMSLLSPIMSRGAD